MIFIYIFIIGLPAVLLFFAIRKLLLIKAIEKNGISTWAVITHIRQNRHSKSPTDSITLEYKDGIGTKHIAKVTTQPGNYQLGRTVPIKYLDNKSYAYAIDGMQPGQWFIIIVWILLLAFTIYASGKIDALVQGSNYRFDP